ncbi:Short-chain dehydrogenase/reductase SDR [hydrothermal vent metagenome]|uniref:Short-chain dehydrogenase/reductase SDR n=1 Tax=hydrothermal vent metagenome TaxID=652676 RepID=A0A3B0RJ52_9ZZZZ
MEIRNGMAAVVTGAASGIGLALTKALCRSGLHVLMADIDGDTLDTARAGLGDLASLAAVRVCDVSDESAVNDLADLAFASYPTVDLVVNNAGVSSTGSVLESTIADWEWVLGVDLYGVIHGIRAFVPRMISQGGGYVVNTASVAGLVSTPGMAPYNVAKHGVVTLSETLYQELQLADANVGVSVVCPAWVATRIADSDRNRPGGPQEDSEIGARVRAAVRAATEHGRSPDSVADQIVEAIRRDQFYVMTHTGMMSFIKRRNREIETGGNPTVDTQI